MLKRYEANSTTRRAAALPREGRRALSQRCALLALGAVTALCAGATSVRAQFSVSPVIVEVPAADTTFSQVVTLTNVNAESRTFRFYAADFEQAANGEHTFAESATSPTSCSQRLRVTPDGATVEAGQSMQFRVLVAPGDGAACWSIVFVESARNDAVTGVRIGERIGVKIYGQPSDPVVDAAVVAATVDTTGAKPAVTFTFRNSGTATLRPEGVLEIRTLDGRTVQTYPVEAFSALPGHERQIPVRIEKELTPGSYIAVPIIDYGGDFLAGFQQRFEVD